MANCPRCGSRFKYVKSIQSDVCYDCGFSQKVLYQSSENIYGKSQESPLLSVFKYLYFVCFSAYLIFYLGIRFFVDNEFYALLSNIDGTGLSGLAALAGSIAILGYFLSVIFKSLLYYSMWKLIPRQERDFNPFLSGAMVFIPLISGIWDIVNFMKLRKTCRILSQRGDLHDIDEFSVFIFYISSLIFAVYPGDYLVYLSPFDTFWGLPLLIITAFLMVKFIEGISFIAQLVEKITRN